MNGLKNKLTYANKKLADIILLNYSKKEQIDKSEFFDSVGHYLLIDWKVSARDSNNEP